MTEQEQLETVRVLTGGKEADSLLSAYLKIAGNRIINIAYPYRDDVLEVPDKYHFLQCELACYLINKRGAEGQVVHSENGIERGYENADLPLSMIRQITPYCGVV